MKGGVLTIGGNAGPLVGERMRRGLVIVGGDAGDYAGGRMIAGTILFKRKVGRGAGYGLRRGSLIFVEEPNDLLPTFGDCGVMEFDYLRLLEHWLRESGKRDQPRRPRAAADGRHVRARQGRDADPGLKGVTRNNLDVDTSNAHMGYARPSSGCRAIGYQMTAAPYVLLDDSLTPGGRSLLYTEPEQIVAADAPDEVEPALDQISAGLARGLHAAGFFAYELGYCLEPKLKGLLPDDRRVPLLWIGLFRDPRPLDDEATRAWLESERRRRARQDLRPHAVLVARAL